jgi:hypothetical protein
VGLKQNQELLARYPVLEYFQYNHLPEGPLRRTSAQFNTLAWKLAKTLPDGAEKSVALRKLLEGKDAAVRAALGTLPEVALNEGKSKKK